MSFLTKNKEDSTKFSLREEMARVEKKEQHTWPCRATQAGLDFASYRLRVHPATPVQATPAGHQPSFACRLRAAGIPGPGTGSRAGGHECGPRHGCMGGSFRASRAGREGSSQPALGRLGGPPTLGFPAEISRGAAACMQPAEGGPATYQFAPRRAGRSPLLLSLAGILPPPTPELP